MLFGDVAACHRAACVSSTVQNETESLAACHRAACVLCAVQNEQHTTQTPFHDILPHHQITYNVVILLSVLT